MSEFSFDMSELEQQSAADRLSRFVCDKCGKEHIAWKQPARCGEACDSTTFSVRPRAASVPVTTGYEVEITYDNLNSIDDAVEQDATIEEQNRDLQKLEKARR